MSKNISPITARGPGVTSMVHMIVSMVDASVVDVPPSIRLGYTLCVQIGLILRETVRDKYD